MQGTGRAAQLSVAQCIAALCVAAGDKQVASTVTTLLKSLGVSGAPAAPVEWALPAVQPVP